MAVHCFRITTSPESATCLHPKETCEGDARPLASFPHHHKKKGGDTTSPVETLEGVDGIIAALEHSNRVCEIDLGAFRTYC
jgi:hypothetical protein